jgi:RimJ/RimL family protein N-acetyltransferase
MTLEEKPMSENNAFQFQISLQTSRLLLKELTATDAEALFQYRSHPEVTRYQGFAPTSVEEALHFIVEEICHVMDQPDTWFQLGVFLGKEQTLIGDLGMHFLPIKVDSRSIDATDCVGGEVEIGVTIGPGFQGRGFASEAIGCVLAFLFDTLHKSKVVASVDPKNQKSMALVASLGFTLKGIIENAVLFRGEWTDDAVFELTAKQWEDRLT